MLRARIRRVVDPLLALALIATVVTGVLMERQEEHEGALMELHGGIAVAVVVLAVVHVAVNWPMLRATFRRGRSGAKPAE